MKTRFSQPPHCTIGLPVGQGDGGEVVEGGGEVGLHPRLQVHLLPKQGEGGQAEEREKVWRRLPERVPVVKLESCRLVN